MMKERASLHFIGTNGLIAGRAFVRQLTAQLDQLQQWKRGEGPFKDHSKFTEGCGVGIDLPEGAELRLELKL